MRTARRGSRTYCLESRRERSVKSKRQVIGRRDD
jgi:hypothetical protein